MIVDCSLLNAATKGVGSLLARLDELDIVVIDVENIAGVPAIAMRKRPLPGGRAGSPVEIEWL